jgi:hypothetical protein
MIKLQDDKALGGQSFRKIKLQERSRKIKIQEDRSLRR